MIGWSARRRSTPPRYASSKSFTECDSTHRAQLRENSLQPPAYDDGLTAMRAQFADGERLIAVGAAQGPA